MNDLSIPPMKRCGKCGETKVTDSFHRDKSTADGYGFYCKACKQTPASKAREKDRLTWPQDHKRCTKCQEIRPYSAFSPDKRKGGGLFSWCKSCHTAHDSAYHTTHREQRSTYAKEYSQQNTDKIKAYRRLYHAQNRERANEYSRQWRANNPERVKENNRRWVEENKQYRQEYRRQWYAEHREQTRAYMAHNRARYSAHIKRAYTLYPDRYRAYNHKRRARIALIGGFFTDKDIAHMRAIQQGHCCYCGRVGLPLEIEHVIPVTREGSSNDPWNLALACKSCNSSKCDRTIEEWIIAGRWFDNLNLS